MTSHQTLISITCSSIYWILADKPVITLKLMLLGITITRCIFHRRGICLSSVAFAYRSETNPTYGTSMGKPCYNNPAQSTPEKSRARRCCQPAGRRPSSCGRWWRSIPEENRPGWSIQRRSTGSRAGQSCQPAGRRPSSYGRWTVTRSQSRRMGTSPGRGWLREWPQTSWRPPHHVSCGGTVGRGVAGYFKNAVPAYLIT